ncbi:hypothetical protein Aglo02_20810 [Actinokineospora globicatena]|nr:hypothetical protein Aglo02_20810 [Actinokineospora globicatena]
MRGQVHVVQASQVVGLPVTVGAVLRNQALVVAHPKQSTEVPADAYLEADGLSRKEVGRACGHRPDTGDLESLIVERTHRSNEIFTRPQVIYVQKPTAQNTLDHCGA